MSGGSLVRGAGRGSDFGLAICTCLIQAKCLLTYLTFYHLTIKILNPI